MIIMQGRRKSVDFTALISWFLLYSFLGWIYETMYCSLKAGHFVSRGFLIGPLIPIYGLCIVSAIALLYNRSMNIAVLFISCAIIASAFEYLTSLWMEYVFGRRWWDYSRELFNINGRVCLGAALIFGFFGVVIIKYLHPNIVRIMNYYLPTGILKRATQFVFIIFILDVCISFLKSLSTYL